MPAKSCWRCACLLASPSLAEEETGGLVAFQEKINGVRFHAMVDASITEAPVIEGAFWDPASGHEALAQNLGAYFGVPPRWKRKAAPGATACIPTRWAKPAGH